ncbi:hypothetical protein IT774_14495 [Salinimonas marina]|uniref:CopL family metal-binding regulatory protein n=1 Tax=Salinimonas marina TaxID=2785918 RepID=A0A7S9DWK1_9ALTE|nr:hypothetical protein [Salinimonas marina]QPG05304.1 hypothetical protein IT774_14495 [Salinimonas marina]
MTRFVLLMTGILMLFALSGTAQARDAENCDMNHSPALMMEASEASSHHALSETSMSMEKCCEQECQCPAGTCSVSFSLLHSTVLGIPFATTAGAIISASDQAPLTIIKVFFRPPIVT